MTDKRFTIIDGVKKGTHSGIWDNQKQHNQGTGDELWIGEVVGMLNEGVAIVKELDELNDENQILKATNEEYGDALGRLEEENNDLKNNLCVFTELNRPLGTIIEENRHLKAFIKQLTNNCGEIVLMNGNAYNVKKILGDIND